MKVVLRVFLALVLLAGILVGCFFGLDAVRRGVIYPLEYEEIVTECAARYELAPALVFAIIKAESSFDAQAKSSAGAIGLMQLMPATYEDLCRRQKRECDPARLTEPEENIAAGCFQLRRLSDIFADPTAVIAAYNAGEGRVKGWLNDPALSLDGRLSSIPFRETNAYVERVQKYIREYEKLYAQEKEWNLYE